MTCSIHAYAKPPPGGVAGCERPGADTGRKTGQWINGSEDLINRVGSNTAPCPHDVATPMGIKSTAANRCPFLASGACTNVSGQCATLYRRGVMDA